MLMLEAPETLPRNTGSLPAVFESLSRPCIPLHRSINAHSASRQSHRPINRQSPRRQATRESLLRLPSDIRSEAHTSELQSLMRISYAVFCLKKNNVR